LKDYPSAFRFLADLLGRQARSLAPCRCAEQSLEQVKPVRAAIAPGDRVSVYYAEGPDGLSTECDTSVHAQLIPLSGGINVHPCNDGDGYGMQ
jgi:iron complex transport system substrate-binding protein